MDNKLTFIFGASENHDSDNERRMFSVSQSTKKAIDISIDTLKSNMSEVIKNIESSFMDIPVNAGDFVVKSIKLNLSISIDGKIGVIAELGASASSAIELVLERKSK